MYIGYFILAKLEGIFYSIPYMCYSDNDNDIRNPTICFKNGSYPE